MVQGLPIVGCEIKRLAQPSTFQMFLRQQKNASSQCVSLSIHPFWTHSITKAGNSILPFNRCITSVTKAGITILPSSRLIEGMDLLPKIDENFD